MANGAATDIDIPLKKYAQISREFQKKTFLIDGDIMQNIFQEMREMSKYLDHINVELGLEYKPELMFHQRWLEKIPNLFKRIKQLLDAVRTNFCIEYNVEFCNQRANGLFDAIENVLNSNTIFTSFIEANKKLMQSLIEMQFYVEPITFGLETNWLKAIELGKENLQSVNDPYSLSLIDIKLRNLNKLLRTARNSSMEIPNYMQTDSENVRQQSDKRKEILLKMIDSLEKNDAAKRLDYIPHKNRLKNESDELDKLIKMQCVIPEFMADWIYFRQHMIKYIASIEASSTHFIRCLNHWILFIPMKVFIDVDFLEHKLFEDITKMHSFRRQIDRITLNFEWINECMEYLKLIQSFTNEVNVRMINIDEIIIKQVGQILMYDNVKSRKWGHRQIQITFINYLRLYGRFNVGTAFGDSLGFDFNVMLKKFDEKIMRLTRDEDMALKGLIKQAADKIKCTLSTIKPKVEIVSAMFNDPIKISNRVRMILYEIFDVFESTLSQDQTATLEYYEACMEAEYQLAMQCAKNSNHQMYIEQIKQSIDELCKSREVGGLTDAIKTILAK